MVILSPDAGGSSAGIFFHKSMMGERMEQKRHLSASLGETGEIFPYSKRVFSSGIRVLYRYLSSPLVCLSLWVRAGSSDEMPEKNGLAHFFEHMVFKGTKHNPGVQLIRRVQAMGGNINAGTSLDTTDFYILVPREFWKEALELLTELVKDPLLSHKDIESEKSVVIQEIHMEEDEPEERLARLLYQQVFKNTSYGRPILGEPKTVGSLSREDILTYKEEYFQPSNIVLSVAGDLEENVLFSCAEEMFDSPYLSKIPEFTRSVTFLEPGNCKVEVGMDIERTYGAFSFLCPGFRQDMSYTIRLLSTVLGQGIASRLNMQLREKAEIVDTIYTTYSSYQAAGLFVIWVTFLEGERERVEEAVQTELLRIVSQPPDEKECKRSRNLLKGSFFQTMETVQGNADMFGRYDAIDTVDRICRFPVVLNSLRGEDLVEMTERYLSWDHAVSVWVGPERHA